MVALKRIELKLKQVGQKGALVVALVSTIAGIKAASNFVSSADAVVSQPETSDYSSAQETADFLVCSEATDWQRPSQEQQRKQLADAGRYGELLQDKDFQEFASQFWQHDVLSFTTYGLSARMEPVNLSGLWSVADDVWANCYSQNEGNAINEGSLAEAWLMHYQVINLQWQDDHYVMLVEPSQQGMQVVQFTRREMETDLPLMVMTPQGVVVEHHDADW